jgi:hypothetical protein
MPLLFLVLALIVGLGFVWSLFITARRGKPAIDPSTGAMTFRHGWMLRWFAVFALFGAQILLAVWAVIYPPQSAKTAFPVAAAAVVLGVVGALLCWEAYRFALILTAGELDCRSPWKARRVVPWEGVTRVEFSTANAWFVLRFSDGQSFRVPAAIPGVRVFLEECERRLKPEQMKPAKGGYELAGRKWPYP